MDYYREIGFKSNPFLINVAEREEKYLQHIFVEPKYFNDVVEKTKSGVSSFIIGQRGYGKTAILQRIKHKMENANVFYILIDSFDDIPIANNGKDFLKLFLEKITTKFAIEIINNPKILKKLNSEERSNLEVIFEHYYDTLSRNQFITTQETITKQIWRNKIKRFLNRAINLINKSDDVIQHYSADIIKSFLNDPNLTISKIEKRKDLFDKFNITEPNKKNVKRSYYFNYHEQKELLNKLCYAIEKVLDFKVVILIDQIDEYKELDSKLHKIVEFIKEILKDNSLINSDYITFVVALWSKITERLENSGVRFDKIHQNTLKWSNEKLIEMLNRRLLYFAHENIQIDNLISNSNIVRQLIELSNGSPRDMFKLLSIILTEQTELNDQSKFIEEEAINSGIRKFIKSYTYISLGSAEKREDVDNLKFYINCVLHTKLIKFDFSNLVKNSQLKNNNRASDCCKLLSEFNILREVDNGEGQGHKLFEVIDPKIIYFIKLGVSSL